MSAENKIKSEPSINWTDYGKAQELIMIRRLVDKAHKFYSDPNNLKAFRVWQSRQKDSNSN